MVIKVLFLDVDGTLTEDRDTYNLEIDVIRVLRRVVEKGVVVSLVSSNAIPVVVGLSRYIGLNGPVIGESGCLVFHGEWGGLRALAQRSAFEPYRAILEYFGDFVYDSWQNRFRLYEYALKLRKEYSSSLGIVLDKIRGFLESRYPGFTVDYSGYALHVREVGVDKGKAVSYVLKSLGVDPVEAGGVGDSVMDTGFLRFLGLSAAVSNADEELKRNVSIVLSKPSGRGVIEFVERYVDP